MEKEKEAKNSSELCPDCERYVGPVSKCPYCGSITSNAGTRRRLKIISCTLIIFGMFFLYMMAVNKEIKLVTVSDIIPAMNYAAIRVRGRVMRVPYIIRRNNTVNYISFKIDDKTGTLRVFARDRVAEEIVHNNTVPHKGDVVEVSGKLTVKDSHNMRLEILAPDKLKK